MAYLISFTHMSMILYNSRSLISFYPLEKCATEKIAALNAILFLIQLSFVFSMEMEKC